MFSVLYSSLHRISHEPGVERQHIVAEFTLRKGEAVYCLAGTEPRILEVHLEQLKPNFYTHTNLRLLTCRYTRLRVPFIV
jgi:hypothetical protein